MKELNTELRIYAADMSELTFGQIRSLRNFTDDEPINNISAVYDADKDHFIINVNRVKELYNFCEKGLRKSPEELKAKIPYFQAWGEIAELILTVCIVREEKRKQAVNINPNSKFISLDGDIFQISKIVSVKKRDDGNRYCIEFYITNRRASIRKEFASKQVRDFEFSRIQKILELAA